MEEVTLHSDEEAGTTLDRLDALTRELRSLRKAVLRQGHAQELFQARIEEAIARLAGAAPPPPASFPNAAQVRTLVELDQALRELLRLADRPGPAAMATMEAPAEDAPRSLGEGLSLLQVRVRNL